MSIAANVGIGDELHSTNSESASAVKIHDPAASSRQRALSRMARPPALQEDEKFLASFHHCDVLRSETRKWPSLQVKFKTD
jgi:hypothetical protein